MKGQFFVHEATDPNDSARRNVHRGVVMGACGPGHWLLKFQGKGFTFNNVLPTEALVNFAFFDSEKERSLYMIERFPPAPAPVELPADASTATASGAPPPATQETPEGQSPFLL